MGRFHPVGLPERGVRAAAGMVPFFKLTGSGNDFIFIDLRGVADRTVTSSARIQALCARGTGVGADGVVFLETDPDADVRIHYYNRDGSLAALCGNATLCTARLAAELGIGDARGVRIATDSGTVRARFVDGLPEFDVPAIERVTPTVPIPQVAGERRLGYALVGVPHIVVEVDDLEAIDLVGRGRLLRSHPWTAPLGANVGFVARDARGGWAMRTYERGVEMETLACGSGSVASATLLNEWGLVGGGGDGVVRLWMRSGVPVDVTLRRGPGGGWSGALRGEGRLVYRGELAAG